MPRTRHSLSPPMGAPQLRPQLVEKEPKTVDLELGWKKGRFRLHMIETCFLKTDRGLR